MWRGLALGGLTIALAVGTVATASAAAPEGSRLAFIREGLPLPAEELMTVDPLGKRAVRIAKQASGPRASGQRHFPSEGFAWSADGTRLGFGWFQAGRRAPIYTLPAGGGRTKPVPGTRGGFNPVFSPDNETLAFERLRFRKRGDGRRPFISTSIWLMESAGGRARQMTPWRDGLFFAPSSFSPDGTRLAAMKEERGEAPNVVSVSIADGSVSLLVENGADPVFSPDGATLAFVRWRRFAGVDRAIPRALLGGDLFLGAADGSAIRRLTFSPGRPENGPSWDPSGERLAYTQLPRWQTRVRSFDEPGSAILEINADGSCEHRLLFTYGLSYWGAAWQPGPGREAGRIAC